ncbi:enolase C-terminal domain-like protein [Streptomyces sp. bgisy034]|uniref:enolase C-terminal domain-like protein n=1 Tax=Streptomyces sp. bgisy034 TaxID=3413774 RepID=UPI003EBB963F
MAAKSTGLDTAGDFEVLGERFGRAGRLEPLAAIDAIAAGVSAVAVRDAIGPDRDLAPDFRGRFSGAMSRRTVPFLEPLLALSVEEPVLPESSRDLGAVVRSISILIAAGERLCSRWDFRSVLSDGIAVTRPDISHAGGISELRRIAAMAEPYDVLVAPHRPLGPIALAATSNPALPSPTSSSGNRPGASATATAAACSTTSPTPPHPSSSATGTSTPTAPGLGITVDEDVVRAAAEHGHRRRNPVWRNIEGSLAARQPAGPNQGHGGKSPNPGWLAGRQPFRKPRMWSATGLGCSRCRK